VRSASGRLVVDILFVTATRIGDAVLSTGLLSHLIAHHAPATLTIVAGPAAAPLFTAVPGLVRLISLEKRYGSLHWLDLYRTVARQRWDIVVDLRGSALAYLLLARRRHVMAKGDPREHRVRQLARLFALDPPPAPRLWLAGHHEDMAARLLPEGGGPVLAIGPAANWRGKEWRGDRFAELARRLAATGPLAGARVVVLAAAHERAQCRPVLDALPPDRCVDLVGRADLLTAAAVLKRCALFIGNDTGLMHIAAAMNTPTLGLFGPSRPEQYAPWGRHAAVVQTAISYEDIVGAADYDHRTTGTQMDSLSVDAVETAARRLWSRVAAAAETVA
jgi:lipopolysaccharide heptosyltransferase III